MRSARSTDSMARTTPAQKPRGEHSTTFKIGFSGPAAIVNLEFPRFLHAFHGPRHGPRRLPCQAEPLQATRLGPIFRQLSDHRWMIYCFARNGGRSLEEIFAMATTAPLMPKATAVWLLDNTALTFDQIAEFCKLHPLEVKAIADGDAAQGIKGLDPIQTGQLTRDQIAQAEANHDLKLALAPQKVDV